jgi:pimeloyl-ACP methyl ester carboxylesterase
MPHIKANNVELYYEDNGPADAPVILLVMGLGTQMIAWSDDFIQGLVASGYRVIHYDNRDIGLSSHMHGAPAGNLVWAMFASRVGLPVSTAYTLGDMAADGVALLDALGISKAHIVGASMGGMIAQLIAATYPDRVLSMTSVMSTSGAGAARTCTRGSQAPDGSASQQSDTRASYCDGSRRIEANLLSRSCPSR